MSAAGFSDGGGDVQAAPLPELPEPEGLFTTTDDGRWIEAHDSSDTRRCTALDGESKLRAYGDARALAALSQGWRPIAEAPTDGTRIMLTVAGVSRETHEQICHLASWDGECCHPFVPNAWTHFHAMPAAPKAADGSGGGTA